MRHIRLASAACAAVLAAGMAAVPATAVGAADATAPKVVSGSAAKDVFVLKPLLNTPAVVSVRVTDAVGVAKVGARLFAPGSTKPKFDVQLTRVSGTAKDGVWRAAVPLKIGVGAGTWSLKAYAADAAGNWSGASGVLDTFAVKKHVFIASWQAVAEGKKSVRVLGTLAVAQLDEYDELAGRAAVVEFRPKGSARWTSKGDTSGIDGGIHYGVMPSSGDGYWRMRFAGGPQLTKAVTSAIYVDMP